MTDSKLAATIYEKKLYSRLNCNSGGCKASGLHPIPLYEFIQTLIQGELITPSFLVYRCRYNLVVPNMPDCTYSPVHGKVSSPCTQV
jgi:hypothetical protein